MNMIPGVGLHIPFAVTDAVKRRQLGDMALMADILLTLVDTGGKNVMAKCCEQEKSDDQDQQNNGCNLKYSFDIHPGPSSQEAGSFTLD
jgi:hypothetical protein